MNWLDNRPRVPLPIDEKLPEILQLIDSNQVVICSGEPGCGKTTRVAQAVILAHSTIKVILTQPRRNVCRWNGKRIATELGSKIGDLVGFQLLDGPSFMSSITRIHLMVELTLINIILGKKKLPEGLIIVDEVHERSQNVDLLLGLIRLYLPDSPRTHLLIMSATIQLEKFSNFFNQAPFISIKGTNYPVEENIVYLLKNEHHLEGVIRSAKKVADNFFTNVLFVKDEKKNKVLIHKGSVIILLPSKQDINIVKAALLRLINPRKKIEVLECHSLISNQAQEAMYKPVSENTLRFVCGTDSLRDSVTVPETFGVIDSLEYNRKFVDFTGTQKIKKIPISLADAIQAKRRTGRTRPGFYWPISYKDPLTRKDVYSNLENWNAPAILRESLDTLAFRLITMGLSIRTFPLPEEIPQKRLDQTIQRLKEFELIDENENLTTLGKMFSLKNLEVHEELMLHKAKQYGVCDEIIILLGALNFEITFITHKNPRKRWSPLENDFVELIYAYRAFKAMEIELNTEMELRFWCAQNQLHYDILTACDQNMKNISQKWFQNNSLDFIKARDFDESSLMKVLISGNLCSYAIQEGPHYRSFQTLFKVSSGSICPKDASLIMFGSLQKVDPYGGHNIDQFVHMAAPIKFEWLLEMHPKLIYKKEFGTYFYDPSFDQMRRKEGVFFRWLKLGERSISLPDEVAKEQFAELLAFKTHNIVLISDEEIALPSLGQKELDEILLKNQHIQREALRKRDCKVYKFDELKKYYKEKLKGASNFKEIADVNDLLLTPLKNPTLNSLPKYKPPRIKVTTVSKPSESLSTSQVAHEKPNDA